MAPEGPSGNLCASSSPNGATATHLVTFLIFGSFFAQKHGSQGGGGGFSKLFVTRRRALRGNPHQKSELQETEGLKSQFLNFLARVLEAKLLRHDMPSGRSKKIDRTV